MDGQNTIVIERNVYINEVKYLWKNDVTNTLSDLSENINSPFSRAKPGYKKFVAGMLTETAYEVVGTIDEAYNKWGIGLRIEVNGTEEDYLAIKNAVDNCFPDRHMDCIWSGHIQLPAEIMPKIKNIYNDLNKSWSECGGQEIIKLSDRNDAKGWLRFGFNRENTGSEKASYALCAEAGAYLEKAIAEIKAEENRCAQEIITLEGKLEQSQVQKPKESPVEGAEIDIDKLSKIMKRICKKYTRETGRKFEKLLKDSVEEKYLDENRIIELVRGVKDHIDTHQAERKKSPSGDGLTVQDPDEERSRKCKILVDYLNKDIRQYTDEINSVGIKFGDESIEELKVKFLEEIYNSKEFTDGQKEMVRQRVFGGARVDVSYYLLKSEDQIGEDGFRWTKKSFEEKDVCREYERRLRKELKNKRYDVLDGNGKIFEKWGDAFLEMLKNQNPNTQSDDEKNGKQIREKLRYYQEKSKKLASLHNAFQKGRKMIDVLMSFKKG